MNSLRTFQAAILAVGVVLAIIYAMFMGGVSFFLNNFLRFNPSGHPWDAQNDSAFLAIILVPLGVVLAIEVARMLLLTKAR